MALEIITAHEGELIPVARALFIEYAASLDFDLAFQGFAEEMENLPGDYAPPRGCMLVAFLNGQAAGCIALRPLDGSIGEVKRLYVKPAFQGHGIGRLLAEAVMERATAAGYNRLRLDTVAGMHAANHLYLSLGFYPIDPYCENPLEGARFFEKRLGGG